MDPENHILVEFDPSTPRRNWYFISVAGLSSLSIIISVLLNFVDIPALGIQHSNPIGPKSFIIWLLFLLVMTTLFILKKKAGWILMAVTSIFYAVVIWKFFLKVNWHVRTSESLHYYLLSRGTYFLLTYSIISVLLFTKPLLNYLKIKNMMKYITLLVALGIATLIVIS